MKTYRVSLQLQSKGGKCKPEKLRIQALFTQCNCYQKINKIKLLTSDKENNTIYYQDTDLTDTNIFTQEVDL